MAKGGGGAGSGARATSFAREQDLAGESSLLDQSSEWFKGLTREERLSVMSHIANSYKMNLSLRGSEIEVANNESVSADIKALDSAIEKFGGLKQDATFYRGLNAGTNEEMFTPKLHEQVMALALKVFPIGHIIEDKGFAPLTTKLDVASAFAYAEQANFGHQYGVILEVRAPKGSHAAPLMGAQMGNPLEQNIVKHEQEVVPARGSRFRITGYGMYTDKGSGHVVGQNYLKVNVDLLPPEKP